MSFWRRLFGTLGPPRAGPSLVRRLTRLRRLNRRYREFLALFVDAAEKQGEGFILDRQYIVSLAERAYRLGYEILFHANVLRPGVALGGYAALDRFKSATRELLAAKWGPLDGRPPVQAAGGDEFPEESVGGFAAGPGEPRTGPNEPSAVPEVSPRQLREARGQRVPLIENEGYVACPGVASGRVRPVQNEADLHAFPGHGVLVAARLEPTPPLLRTLPRVAAILVEQGTPRDRIAALARSFRVPTLLGVPGVTRRLPSGELVTVDATDGVVYSGVFEELIHHHVQYGGSRSEEPEYRLLNAVLREMGSPLLAASPEDRQTLCEYVEIAYAITLSQLAAGLRRMRGSSAVASPGFSEGIRTVNLSAPASGAPPEAPGVSGGPDPSGWVLAGLVAAEGGGTRPPARDARGLLYRSEESATALLRGGERVVLLDVVVAGGTEGNHVMLCASERSGGTREKAEGLDRVYADAVRLGLLAVRASRTVVAWREGLPPGSAKETLTRLGQLARRATLDTWAAQSAAG